MGLALKRKGFKVVGTSRRRITIEKAQAFGAIDVGTASIHQAIRSADLAVIATPISKIRRVFQEIKNVKTACVITDVGSTKSEIVGWAEEILPPESQLFVGSHPMAGTEKRGIKHAQADLFEGCTWCITPTSRTRKEAIRTLIRLVRTLDAIPFVIDPRAHDETVAKISHLPLIVSTALVNCVTKEKDWRLAQKLAATGFKDTTRLASGNIQMHKDICISNKEYIVPLLEKFLSEVEAIKATIQTNKEALLFEKLLNAKTKRDSWIINSRFATEAGDA